MLKREASKFLIPLDILIFLNFMKLVILLRLNYFSKYVAILIYIWFGKEIIVVKVVEQVYHSQY